MGSSPSATLNWISEQKDGWILQGKVFTLLLIILQAEKSQYALAIIVSVIFVFLSSHVHHTFFKLMWFYFDDHTGIPAASLGITERGVVGYPGVRKARLLLGLFSVGDCCVITVFVASLNWKKKQDFIDTSSPRFVTHKTMNGKSTNGTLGGMACIEGLPPLPKSLSGLLNSSGGSWREMERMYVKKTMIQDDLSRGRNNADNLLANKPANLDAALALLRKEMVTFSVFSFICRQESGPFTTAGLILAIYIHNHSTKIPKETAEVFFFRLLDKLVCILAEKLRLFENNSLLIDSAYKINPFCII